MTEAIEFLGYGCGGPCDDQRCNDHDGAVAQREEQPAGDGELAEADEAAGRVVDCAVGGVWEVLGLAEVAGCVSSFVIAESRDATNDSPGCAMTESRT